MTIAIIAALVQEAAAFMPASGSPTQLAHLPVRRIVHDGRTIIVVTSGIGKVNTALAAGLVASAYKPDLFIEIGTCGKIGTRAGDCFWLESAVQHDYGAARPGRFVHYDAGAWPIGPDSVTPFSAMSDPGLGLPHCRIASGDAFIECPDKARFLAEGLRADVVDMETAAMAQVCAQIGVPWAAIKATTDDADDAGAGDFMANLAAASARAAAAAERLITLIPPPRHPRASLTSITALANGIG